MRASVTGALAISTIIISAPLSLAQVGKELVGSWALVSNVIDDGAKKFEPFGPNPKGFFHFDGSRFSIIVVRDGLSKVASNNRMTATADENKAVVQGSLAVFGTYTISNDGQMTQMPEASTYANWTGVEQKRSVRITGDTMVLTNPAGSAGGIATVMLKRFPQPK